MNLVALFGRLVRDPELRYTQSQMAYCRFTVAVDRRMSREKRQEAESNNQPTADFIGCVAWGKTAEIISQYFQKGSQIAVDGRIQTGSYERDGRRVYTTDVVNNFSFINSSQPGQAGGQKPQRQNPAPPVNSAYDQGGSFGDDDMSGFYPVDNDEIPF